MLTGGVFNGILAQSNGLNFWDGSVSFPPVLPAPPIVPNGVTPPKSNANTSELPRVKLPKNLSPKSTFPRVVEPDDILPPQGPVKLIDKVEVPKYNPGYSGRTIPTTITEKWAMQIVQRNPYIGRPITSMGPLNDSKWTGFTKMMYTSKYGVEIHYNAKWVDGVIKAVGGFKFKP